MGWTYPHNGVHVPDGRDIDLVEHVGNGLRRFEPFPFPRIEHPQSNRRKTDVGVDNE